MELICAYRMILLIFNFPCQELEHADRPPKTRIPVSEIIKFYFHFFPLKFYFPDGIYPEENVSIYTVVFEHLPNKTYWFQETGIFNSTLDILWKCLSIVFPYTLSTPPVFLKEG